MAVKTRSTTEGGKECTVLDISNESMSEESEPQEEARVGERIPVTAIRNVKIKQEVLEQRTTNLVKNKLQHTDTNKTEVESDDEITEAASTHTNES